MYPGLQNKRVSTNNRVELKRFGPFIIYTLSGRGYLRLEKFQTKKENIMRKRMTAFLLVLVLALSLVP